MNYIIHINTFLEKAPKEDWMEACHISLYMALFNIWNKVGFRKVFFIRRMDIMKAAKITSRNTYYKCLRDLENGQYLKFYPSTSRFTQATVSIIPLLDTTQVPPQGPVTSKSGTVQVPLQGPLQQTNIKTITNSVLNGPTLDDTVRFFMMHQYSTEEALRFWYHNESTGWMAGNTPVRNWQPLAHKWMLNASQNTTNETSHQDYDDPL